MSEDQILHEIFEAFFKDSCGIDATVDLMGVYSAFSNKLSKYDIYNA